MRRIRRLSLASLVLLVLFVIVFAIVYAGSPGTIANGIKVDGVDVGGLSTAAAVQTLDKRSQAVVGTQVAFTAGHRTFKLRARKIELQPDWAKAVAAARREGDGFGPLRGFQRLKIRLFGADVAAAATYSQAKLDRVVAAIARKIDQPHREAALVLHGLHPAIVPASAGSVLDRKAAGAAIVAALGSLSRGTTVALPMKVDTPKVTGSTLQPALAKARAAVSAPVVLTLGPTRYKLPRWRIAGLLELPAAGKTELRIGGPGADAYFKRLQKVVNQPPHDAAFAVTTGGIRIVPSRDGHVLDVPKTAAALLAASSRRLDRVVAIPVATQAPKRTTADAQAMGINGLVSSYTTLYGGVPNRIHNVEVVSHLVDNTLIGPGKEFSFNGTTGERNAAKGLLEAPVIINGELQNGLGGGTCQVSTTVFNAAYEAGLPITARTNHALYISHYPQGRDATVNYPDVDLKFVNDTDHWLLLRTFVSSSSLTVNLYGTPQHRRVESVTAPLVTTGPVPTVVTKDPTLTVGTKVVDQAGSPPLSTSVERKVYAADGKLLYDNTWYSSYVGEKEQVRVGTKPKPKPKPKIKPSDYLPTELVPGAAAAGAGTTGTTGTTTTGTTPAATGTTGPTG